MTRASKEGDIVTKFGVRSLLRKEIVLLVDLLGLCYIIINLTPMQPKAMRYFCIITYKNQGNPASGKKTLSVGVPTSVFPCSQ